MPFENSFPDLASLELSGTYTAEQAVYALGGHYRLDWSVHSNVPRSESEAFLVRLVTTAGKFVDIAVHRERLPSETWVTGTDFLYHLPPSAYSVEPLATDGSAFDVKVNSFDATPDRTAPIQIEGAGSLNSAPFRLEAGDYKLEWSYTTYSGADGSCVLVMLVELSGRSTVCPLYVHDLPPNLRQSDTERIERVQEGDYFLHVTGRHSDWSLALTPIPQQFAKPTIAVGAAPQSPHQREPGEQDLTELQSELDSMIGLTSVKRDVVGLVNLLKVQRLRVEQSLPVTPVTLHSVFHGNPGTGKTSVARLLANVYKSMGILSKGHLVETDRSGLVAEYLGQTALKTAEVVNSAVGGVLFIDEAYALTAGHWNEYGLESISTLLKLMEDHRDDLVVIVAGYPDKMAEFLSSNPGLKSRFPRTFLFADYSVEELAEIFFRSVNRESFVLSDAAYAKLPEVLSQAYAARDEGFGNGRFVRTLFERTIARQANRLATLVSIDRHALMFIDADDIPDSDREWG
jgi:hypothetical protein